MAVSRWLACAAMAALLGLCAQAAPAAGSASPSAPPASASVKSAAAANGPQWVDLSPAQKVALQPLSARWSSLSELQRRKWIALAHNYPTMTPTEQGKLHSRMTDWASLSMQQRDQARVNYAQAKAIPADERQEKWRKYQELSPAEKAALANKAKATPKGAAPAIRPSASQQLTVVSKRPRVRHGANLPNTGASAPVPALGTASAAVPAPPATPVPAASNSAP